MTESLVQQYLASFDLTDLLTEFMITDEYVVSHLIEEGLIPLDYFTDCLDHGIEEDNEDFE